MKNEPGKAPGAIVVIWLDDKSMNDPSLRFSSSAAIEVMEFLSSDKMVRVEYWVKLAGTFVNELFVKIIWATGVVTGYWAMFAAMAESLNPPLEQSIVTVVEGMYLVAGLQGQVRELAGTFGQLQ